MAKIKIISSAKFRFLFIISMLCMIQSNIYFLMSLIEPNIYFGILFLVWFIAGLISTSYAILGNNKGGIELHG